MDKCEYGYFVQCPKYAEFDVLMPNDVLAVCEYHANQLHKYGAQILCEHNHADTRLEPLDNPAA